jgi:hypothetical protein
MRSKIILRWLLGFVLIMPVACSSDSSDLLTDLGSIFIPNFSNDWQAIKARFIPSDFFFNIDPTDVDSAKGTGKFNNSSNQQGTDRGGNGFEYHFNGTFDNTKVNIHFLTNTEFGGDNGPQQGQNYKGIFDTLTQKPRIRLVNTSNASDSIVIERQ